MPFLIGWERIYPFKNKLILEVSKKTNAPNARFEAMMLGVTICFFCFFSLYLFVITLQLVKLGRPQHIAIFQDIKGTISSNGTSWTRTRRLRVQHGNNRPPGKPESAFSWNGHAFSKRACGVWGSWDPGSFIVF